jgi:Helix-turn-helix of DDE superfamily endonuclease
MTYKQIEHLNEQEFKRLCGVKPKLFQEMVKVLKPELPKPKHKGGQPKLSIEDQLLIALEYWRSYRTYFHIAQSWGVHESTVCRIIHRVEDKLINSTDVSSWRTKFASLVLKKFSLPGKKELLKDESEWSVVIVNVGESPIERPQKNRKTTTVARKKDTLSSLR